MSPRNTWKKSHSWNGSAPSRQPWYAHFFVSTTSFGCPYKIRISNYLWFPLGTKFEVTPVWEFSAWGLWTSGETLEANPAWEGLFPPRRVSTLVNVSILRIVFKSNTDRKVVTPSAAETDSNKWATIICTKRTYPKVVSVHIFSSRQGGISPSLYVSPMLLTLFIVFAGRKHSMLLSSFNLSQQF